MATEIYGCSDDLIEFRGDVDGEVGGGENGTLVACSDGTLLDVRYGKAELGIWAITVLRRGDLFLDVEACTDEDAERYSDTARFGDGLKWAYAAHGYKRVE